MPTGSAVVADVVDIGKEINKMETGKERYHFLRPSALRIRKIEDIESMYYFRFSAIDKPGVLSKISGILGDNNISIASVIQKGRRIGGAVPLVVLTHLAVERDVLKAIKEIDKLPVVTEPTHFIRVEGGEG